MPPGMQLGAPPPAKLSPEEIKNVFYAIGSSVGKGVGDAFGPTKEEWAELRKGIQDSIDGKDLRVKPEEVQMKVRQLEGERREERHKEALKENETKMAKFAKEAGMTKLESGVLIKHGAGGKGEQPKPTDTVSVKYKGTTTDGKEFDSSDKHGGQPTEFALNRVIKCWTDGVGAMKVGEKARLVCPSDLAYGPNPPPGSGIPANSILIFDVELISTKAAPPPAPTPQMNMPIKLPTNPAGGPPPNGAPPAGGPPPAHP
jgi:FKBP-type peptidyl-prolyl cis-trans isomerase FkpA